MVRISKGNNPFFLFSSLNFHGNTIFDRGEDAIFRIFTPFLIHISYSHHLYITFNCITASNTRIYIINPLKTSYHVSKSITEWGVNKIDKHLYMSLSIKSSSFILRRDCLVSSPSADQKSTSVSHESLAVCRAQVSLVPCPLP